MGLRVILVVVGTIVFLLLRTIVHESLLRLYNFREVFPRDVPNTPTLFICSHDHKNHAAAEDILQALNFARYLTRTTLFGVSIIAHTHLKYNFGKSLALLQFLSKIWGFDFVLLWNAGNREKDAVEALRSGRNVIMMIQNDKFDERSNSYIKVADKKKASSIRRILAATSAKLVLVRFYLQGRIFPFSVENIRRQKRAVYFAKRLNPAYVVHLSDEVADRIVHKSLFKCYNTQEEQLLKEHKVIDAKAMAPYERALAVKDVPILSGNK